MWTATATGGFNLTSPAVAAPILYVGADNKKVYASNSTTGAIYWTYTTGGVIESSPAYANGVVYTAALDGKVYALDASTGTTTAGSLKWTTFIGGDPRLR